jgi:hypothetical protein
VFKPIKTYYHQEATNFMHNNPNSAITKFSFGKLFSAAWKKGTTVGKAVKGFGCTGMHSFNPSAIPEDKFLPSTYFLQDSDDSLSEGAHKIPSENHKPTGPPVVQSTAVLN